MDRDEICRLIGLHLQLYHFATRRDVDDPTAEAARITAERRVSLLLSVHHCFWWDGAVWAGCLARTREWAAPLIATGRVVGIYGPDEPMGGGMQQITHAQKSPGPPGR